MCTKNKTSSSTEHTANDTSPSTTMAAGCQLKANVCLGAALQQRPLSTATSVQCHHMAQWLMLVHLLAESSWAAAACNTTLRSCCVCSQQAVSESIQGCPWVACSNSPFNRHWLLQCATLPTAPDSKVQHICSNYKT